MSSVSTVNIADILDQAVVELEKRGWIKNTYEDERGRVCAAQAVIIAAAIINGVVVPEKNTRDIVSEGSRSAPIFDYIEGVLSSNSRIEADTIAIYNDTPSRRKKDVVNFFRECAAKWREEYS